MAEADPLRRYVEAGIAFTQLTKAKAEAMVRELVKAGDVQREQAQDRVDELLDRHRKNTEGLVALVRREMAQQLSSMGFATKEDLARLEARVDRLQPASAAPATPGRQTAAKATKAAKGAKTAKPASKAAKTARARPPSGAAAPPPGTAARTSAAKPPRRRPSQQD